jgi:anti-anti-sigma factor
MSVSGRPCSIHGGILYLDGPLRMGGAVRRRVGALLRRGERQIILDLKGVTSIDAAGLGELVRAYKLARATNGTLHVVNPRARVRKLIERVGLGDLLLAEPVTVSPSD